jgi:hypothetical protein
VQSIEFRAAADIAQQQQFLVRRQRHPRAHCATQSQITKLYDFSRLMLIEGHAEDSGTISESKKKQ